MDERLRYLLEIKDLQDEVIFLRTEMPSLYGKWFKRLQTKQLKQLLNVSINIPVTEVEIPDRSNLPTEFPNIQPKLKTEDLEKECKDLAEVLELI